MPPAEVELARIVVAQPAPPPGRPHGGLSVGVLRWWGPEPCLSIVVKASFDYGPPDGRGDGAAGLRPTDAPPAMSLDEQRAGADGELYTPSDFVPKKGEADVVLVGHAFATGGADRRAPLPRMDCELGVGGLRRAFAVGWDEPSAAIPLDADCVLGGGGAELRRVGPSRVDVDPARTHGEGFDYAAYNCAPPSQRLRSLEPDAEIELVGLSRYGERRRLRLPGLAPVVAVELPWQDEALVIDMTLDTLWIDTDQERMVLAWRGAMLVRNDGSEIVRIIASLEPHDTPRTWPELGAALGRGRVHYATRAADLAPRAEPIPTEDATLQAARAAAILDAPPEPELDLETYAQLSAELAETSDPAQRQDILERRDWDEDRWAFEERAWLDKMSRQALDGDLSLTQQYSAELAAAQDALGKPDEQRRTVADLAAILVDMETAEDPMKALADRRMTLAELVRLQRRLVGEQTADPDASSRLQEEMKRLRQARPAAEEPGELDEGD